MSSTCGIKGNNKDATNWMEWKQMLLPENTMPAGPFKAKAKEYIARFMRETMLDMLLRCGAGHYGIETFGVSRQAAKIRSGTCSMK